MRVSTLVLGLVILLGAVAEACNVPVFRYALERWQPDPYRVVCFHRGALTDDQRKLANSLADRQDQALANFIFRTVDLDALEAEDRAAALELFATQKDPPLPWITVQYPVHLGLQKPVWAGSLSRESIAALVDSPARQELARRLGEGETAVWLLLESGQDIDDDAASVTVLTELKKLEQDLKLPELSNSPDDQVRAGVPLQIAFSLLRVSRNDAVEKALVRMLLDSESDLAERTEPMVFPVYGRGRALFGFVGAGITADNVRGAAAFLTGACSCEVKELNPGFDILLAKDWNTIFADDGEDLASAANRAMKVTAGPEFVLIPPGSESPKTDTPAEATTPPASAVSDRQQRWWFAGLAIAVAIGLAMTALMRRRVETSGGR